ncbi:hypothetical protein FKM82_007208 [Ascaphus truei]
MHRFLQLKRLTECASDHAAKWLFNLVADIVRSKPRHRKLSMRRASTSNHVGCQSEGRVPAELTTAAYCRHMRPALVSRPSDKLPRRRNRSFKRRASENPLD